MADNSTPSTPASTPAPSTSTLGTSAAGQAQSAQIHKNAPVAPNAPAAPSNAAKPVQAAANQAKAVINDPNAPKAAKVEAKKMLKQLSYKLDGQDFTENLPF